VKWAPVAGNGRYQVQRTARLLEEGVRKGVFPGAVLIAAHKGEVRFLKAVGNRALFPQQEPMAPDTIFDLASLTKPLATSVALMKLVDNEELDLDEPLEHILEGEGLGDKAPLTPRLLLCHRSGLPDWRPYFQEIREARPGDPKRFFRKRILSERLVCEPGAQALYSDLGFMLLEWVVEKRSGKPLDTFLHENIYGPLGLKDMFLYRRETKSPQRPPDRFAATERCPWRGEVLCGVVHDENAYAAGGYSGHAGLFGTAREVYVLADLLADHYRGVREDQFRPDTVRTFLSPPHDQDGAAWALGWDTPSGEDSSAGRFFSRESVGHLGFTGTSLWMDLQREVIVVFLTNRVHPSRQNEAIRSFRPRIHDSVMLDLFSGDGRRP